LEVIERLLVEVPEKQRDYFAALKKAELSRFLIPLRNIAALLAE
jgi:hypothetical protein